MLAETRTPGTWSRFSKSIAHAVAAAFQFSRPAGDVENWETDEVDGGGRYTVAYHRQDEVTFSRSKREYAGVDMTGDPVLATSFIRGSCRPPIVMMEPVENGTRDDVRSGGAVVRRRRQRNALLESLMRSGSIEVGDVLVEHRAKMVFAKDDDVIETLATDTSEKSLAHSVHQWGAVRGLHDANASTLCDAIEPRAELVVVIPDDELWTTAEMASPPATAGPSRIRSAHV